ncbi:MAG: 4-hydroxybenzoate octaprenyltransferase [Rhodospirillales bacterium]|nr:4-hydroxybenzoate octaprenyltransferase [Alphaproteobacteria bacterium]USO04250.1 MAG: 4-hydroxybenzoate octaprenyltransferase [Rhodospirillales bacterium]
MSHTDIKSKGWVTALPQSWRPYALLMRLDRPIGWWLLLLPGWWAIVLASGGPDISTLILMGLFWAGAIVMRGAGCIINDLWDRNLDKKVARTRLRPLASGAVSVKQALVFLVVLLALGLAILLQMPPTCILLGLFSITLIVIYPYMKRITFWPQAFLGLTFNFGALMGWAAVTDDLRLPALLLYAASIFWTLGYDTIYAHQDREDDAVVGVKSTALLFGSRSKIWVAGFFISCWILLCAAGWAAAPGSYIVHFLVPAGAHFFWQLYRWDMNDPASSLRIFKSNQYLGLLVLLGFFMI